MIILRIIAISPLGTRAVIGIAFVLLFIWLFRLGLLALLVLACLDVRKRFELGLDLDCTSGFGVWGGCGGGGGTSAFAFFALFKLAAVGSKI